MIIAKRPRRYEGPQITLGPLKKREIVNAPAVSFQEIGRAMENPSAAGEQMGAKKHHLISSFAAT